MFNPDLHADNRKRLLGKMRPDSVAIIPTAPVANYSRDTDYRYRPDSNFYYLTGFREPESVAILDSGNPDAPFTLFCRPRDPDMETWNGRRAGLEGAKEIYRADEVFEIKELEGKLPELLADREAIYHFAGKYRKFDLLVWKAWQAVRMKWRTGVSTPKELHDLGHIIHEMRLSKTPGEMEILREACRIGCEAHELAMRSAKPGMNERDIEALIDHYFRSSGGFGAGFPTIVASGPNAIILHHIENECTIEDGDLVLIDAGVEYEMLNSDISRTWPVNGKFSPEQRAVYDFVLKAQIECVEMTTVDTSPDDVHNHAVRVITEGLIDLKLLQGSVDENIENETFKKFYMHRTGHSLGIDVHDVGNLMVDGKWRKHVPGMVYTVEPGCYIPDNDESIPEVFRGIGVRIEDDVHVTPDGPENLTISCPKLPDKIEEIIGG